MLLIKIFNLLSFIITLLCNYFTTNGFGPFHSITNVSNTYKNLLSPPNWAFSIWGLIYLCLTIFCIVQFIPNVLTNTVININVLFILSNILNIVWLLVFA